MLLFLEQGILSKMLYFKLLKKVTCDIYCLTVNIKSEALNMVFFN